jgi:hypothetical protein
MSIGLTSTKSDIDNVAAAIAFDLRSVMDRISYMQAFLAGKTTQDLTDRGYTTSPVDEVAQLKSAFTDLDKLRTVYQGTATQATAYDFRTFVKFLTGAR